MAWGLPVVCQPLPQAEGAAGQSRRRGEQRGPVAHILGGQGGDTEHGGGWFRKGGDVGRRPATGVSWPVSRSHLTVMEPFKSFPFNCQHTWQRAQDAACGSFHTPNSRTFSTRTRTRSIPGSRRGPPRLCLRSAPLPPEGSAALTFSATLYVT